MANSLTAFNPAYWSKRMQIVRIKEPVYRALANFEERANLKNGDTVHRPYRSSLLVQSYTKGTSVTVQDVTATDESLSVGTTKIVPFYVDDLDQLQNKWDTVNSFADDAGRELEAFIDGDFLGEVANALDTIDDGDIGGTAGNAIVLSSSNVLKVFAAASKKLTNQMKGGKMSMTDRFAVITPTVLQILTEYLAGKDTALADKVADNGRIGMFLGFELYLSVNTRYSATWTPADQPSDNDTVTINGVVWTFETGTIDAAGEVKSETDLETTLTNLKNALNSPGTGISAKHFAVSAANQKLLQGLVATSTATALSIVMEGAGEVVVSASSAADLWSATTAHLMFGKKKCVDLVIQKEPNVVFKDVQDKLGRNVLPWTLYGLKTFVEGAQMMVNVQLDASQF